MNKEDHLAMASRSSNHEMSHAQNANNTHSQDDKVAEKVSQTANLQVALTDNSVNLSSKEVESSEGNVDIVSITLPVECLCLFIFITST